MTITRREQQAGPPAGPPHSPPPYNWKATLWLVIGILLVAGAMGVFMHVIPTPFTQPSATVGPTVRPAQPAVAPTVAPTSAPAAAPTAAAPAATQIRPATVAPVTQPTIAPTTAPTEAPQATSAPTAAPAMQPITAVTSAPVSVPTLVPGAVPTGGVTTPIASTDTSITPALQEEISQAYARFWDVSAQAFWSLDDSQLSSVMADNELAGAIKTMNDLRSEGRAGATSVTHNAVIVKAMENEAQIFDDIADRSFYVDPVTKQPLDGPKEPKPLTGFYFLHKIDGFWKVVDEG